MHSCRVRTGPRAQWGPATHGALVTDPSPVHRALGGMPGVPPGVGKAPAPDARPLVTRDRIDISEHNDFRSGHGSACTTAMILAVVQGKLRRDRFGL